MIIIKILWVILREILILIGCAVVSFIATQGFVTGMSFGCVYSMGNKEETFWGITIFSLYLAPVWYLFARKSVVYLYTELFGFIVNNFKGNFKDF